MKKYIILLFVIITSLSISSAMDLVWSQKVPGGIQRLRYSDDGRYFYTIGGDGYLRKWDSPTGVQVEEKKIPVDSLDVANVSSDGKYLFYLKSVDPYGNGYNFYYWDIINDTIIWLEKYNVKDMDYYAGKFNSPVIEISKDNKLAVLSMNYLEGQGYPFEERKAGYYEKWDLENLNKNYQSKSYAIDFMNISPDKRKIFYATSWYSYSKFSSGSGNNKYIDIDSIHTELVIPKIPNACSFSPDSKKLYIVCDTGYVYIYSLDNLNFSNLKLSDINYQEYFPTSIASNNEGKYLIIYRNTSVNDSLSSLQIINTNTGVVVDSTLFTFFGWCQITLSPNTVEFITYSSDGNVRLWNSNYISNNILKANFDYNINTGTTPLEIKLYDYSTGNIIRRLWDFGDGETSGVENPTHIYTRAGWYKVTLTVSDNSNNVSCIKDSLIHVLDIEFFNNTGFDTVCSYKIQKGTISSMKFGDDGNKIYTTTNMNSISSFNINQKIIEKINDYDEKFKIIGLTNDNQNVYCYAKMDSISYRSYPDDNELNHFMVSDPFSGFLHGLSSFAEIKTLNFINGDFQVFKGDSSFVLTYMYYINAYSTQYSFAGNKSGCILYSLKNMNQPIVLINPMSSTGHTSTFIATSFNSSNNAYAISCSFDTPYKQSRNIINVMSEDTTINYSKELLDSTSALQLAFKNKSKQIIYSDNKYNIKSLSLLDTNDIHLLTKCCSKPTALLVSTDDKFLIVGFDDGFVKLLDLNTNTFVDSVKAPYSIANMALDTINGNIAVALTDGKIYVIKDSIFAKKVDSTHTSNPSNEKYFSYPLPCHDYAKFDFIIDESSNVKITVFNSSGEVIKTLNEAYYDKGKHEIKFETISLPDGIYFIQIQAGSKVQGIKFMKN